MLIVNAQKGEHLKCKLEIPLVSRVVNKLMELQFCIPRLITNLLAIISFQILTVLYSGRASKYLSKTYEMTRLKSVQDASPNII